MQKINFFEFRYVTGVGGSMQNVTTRDMGEGGNEKFRILALRILWTVPYPQFLAMLRMKICRKNGILFVENLPDGLEDEMIGDDEVDDMQCHDTVEPNEYSDYESGTLSRI